jgi:Family of unknown function (DUF6941)
MEVEFAFLADAAQVSPDGKLYVLGAGVDRLMAAQFPAVHPLLTLVVKLKLHATECERPHQVEVELWDPDGQTIGAKVETGFSAPRQPGSRPAFAQIVLSMVQLQFEQPGDYAFQVLVDGQHYKSVPLYLEQQAAT